MTISSSGMTRFAREDAFFLDAPPGEKECFGLAEADAGADPGGMTTVETVDTYDCAYEVHALVVGRAITGIAAF